MNEPANFNDEESLLSIEDGLYFDIDAEFGPDITNWNDGPAAAEEMK